MVFTGLLIAAALALPQTPEDAAHNFFSGGRVQIVHVARTPAYSVITFANSTADFPGSGQLLIKRYAFGWQVIDSVGESSAFSTCNLRMNGATAAQAAALSWHPARFKPLAECTRQLQDTGPASAITGTRAAMGLRRPTYVIERVNASANFAIGVWGGMDAEGEDLYKRTPAGWKFVTGGGGALTADMLRSYGVTAADMKLLFP